MERNACKKVLGVNYPQFSKMETEIISERRFRKISEMVGIRAHFQNNRRLTMVKRRLVNVDLGGGEDVKMVDSEDVVGWGVLNYGENKAKW